MHPKSIEKVSKSYLCCNCGACRAICPTDAISFNKTNIGRLYAYVNDSCIDCGICQKVCPTLSNIPEKIDADLFEGHILSTYVGKATDKNIFLNSQSGGICTALLTYLFDSNKIDAALVVRMDFGSPVPEVEATIINSPEALRQTQKSCYTHVDLLSKLKVEINNYNSIAVVGVGCAIEGLTALQLIRADFREKIFCKIGLICDRTLCGTIQDVYASLVSHINPIKILWRTKYLSREDLHFRYENAPLIILNKNGKYQKFPNIYRFALKDMFTSPRCWVCPNKLNVCSDITLGDPWRIPNIDMENGESLVSSRASKGEEIMKEAVSKGYLTLEKRTADAIIKGQLVNERKKQVAAYAEAFNVLLPQVESHLLDKHQTPESKQVTDAMNTLSSFSLLENKSKNEIIQKGRKLIKRAKFSSSIPYRIASRIYRLIKR